MGISILEHLMDSGPSGTPMRLDFNVQDLNISSWEQPRNENGLLRRILKQTSSIVNGFSVSVSGFIDGVITFSPGLISLKRHASSSRIIVLLSETCKLAPGIFFLSISS